MIKMVFKDLMIFAKDKKSVLLTFAMPSALITLFALVFGGVGSGNKDNRIPMQISDLDRTPESETAMAVFDTLKSIQMIRTDLTEAREKIKKGKEACVLIIGKGFSDSIRAGKKLPLELEYDEAKSTEVGLLQQSLIPTVAMLPFNIGDPKTAMQGRLTGMIGNSDPELEEQIKTNSDQLFDVISKEMSGNPDHKNTAVNFMGGDIRMTKIVAAKKDNSLGLVQAVAGTAVMMLLFSVVGVGTGLLEEKQEGTLKRLLYTPMNPNRILFSKMISTNVISVVQLLVMFLFAAVVFGLDIYSKFVSLLIVILATSFACSAFGVFLASFSKTRQQVQGLSTIIILVMSAIGGSMIPIFFMPEFMQKLAVLSVNYWSIQGFFDIFWRNLPLFSWTFLSRILVLLLIGLLLNLLAVVMYRRNILKMS